MCELIEPEDLRRDRKAPLRRCIVTRESMEKEALIRFVIGPGAVVVPDILCKLPGRGYWVRNCKAALQQAIELRSFPKASKGRAKQPEGLPQQVEALLSEHALASVAMANKAGQLVQGFDKVSEALKKQQAIALIHARDASPESIKKLPISQERRFVCFSAEALSHRLGAENAVHLALLNGPAGQAALHKTQRLTGFIAQTLE